MMYRIAATTPVAKFGFRPYDFILKDRYNATGADSARRNARVRRARIVVHCADYKCSHSVTLSADLCLRTP
jgi:hypothetical protein